MAAIIGRGAVSLKRASILKYVILEILSRLWRSFRGLGVFVFWVFWFLLIVLFCFPAGIVAWIIGLVVYSPAVNTSSMFGSWLYWAGCVVAAVPWFIYVYFEDRAKNPRGQSFWADVRRRQNPIPIMTYPDDWYELRREV